MIESRLAGWLATRAGLLAVRVWVDCDDQVRAARVAEREGTSLTQALIDNADRSDLERARYRAVYDIDLDDRSHLRPGPRLHRASRPRPWRPPIVEQARATFD